MKRFLLLPLLAFTGCATLSTLATNPDSQQALATLLRGAVSFASGDRGSAATDGIEGAAALLRSLQSTPKAAQPTALMGATASGGARPIAKLVADAVAAQVANGTKPDVANEKAAAVLDRAASDVKP